MASRASRSAITRYAVVQIGVDQNSGCGPVGAQFATQSPRLLTRRLGSAHCAAAPTDRRSSAPADDSERSAGIAGTCRRRYSSATCCGPAARVTRTGSARPRRFQQQPANVRGGAQQSHRTAATPPRQRQMLMLGFPSGAGFEHRGNTLGPVRTGRTSERWPWVARTVGPQAPPRPQEFDGARRAWGTQASHRADRAQPSPTRRESRLIHLGA